MTDCRSKMKKKFLLRLDEDTLEALRSEAKYQGVSLSQLLRDVLDDYVKHVVHGTRSDYTKPVKKVDRWWH